MLPIQTPLLLLLLVAGLIPSVLADEIWTLIKMDLQKFPNAKCLDGSPAAFWFLPGHGSGANKFKIHHQGGAWCINVDDCYDRSLTYLGSSSTWEEQPNCDTGSSAQPCVYDGNEGLTDADPTINPVAYNWNKVFLGYCDGASFSGHVSEPVLANDGMTELHFKGRYLLDAIYDTLLEEYKMADASAVIISGTSAGGLSVYLHADYLNEKITSAALQNGRKKPRITALPDAGFFMDYPSIHGEYLFTPNYQNVFFMQNVSDSVNDDCIQFYRHSSNPKGGESQEWKCFFAQYTLPFIQTELFITNSLVDSWQGSAIMGLSCDPNASPSDCSTSEIDYLNAFRENQLENSSLKWFLERNPSAGAWLVECYTHPLVNWNYWWAGNVTVGGLTQGTVFQNWYEKKEKGKHPWIAVDGGWGSNHC
jgi:hypothetical protein